MRFAPVPQLIGRHQPLSLHRPSFRRIEKPCYRTTVVKAVQAGELVEEIDLVAYTNPSGRPALGRVIKVQGQAVTVEPLEADHEAGEEGVYVQADRAFEQVPVASLRQVVEYELSQRQDKVSNPHGEHAHDIFKLLEPLKTILSDS